MAYLGRLLQKGGCRSLRSAALPYPLRQGSYNPFVLQLENILLTSTKVAEADAKLADFGLARSLDGSAAGGGSTIKAHRYATHH